MNKQCWVYGFVFVATILLNAQDEQRVASENPAKGAADPSVQFVELLRQAEAGNTYAQFAVGHAYQTGTGVAQGRGGSGAVVPAIGSEWVRGRSELHRILIRARIGSFQRL